MMARPANFSLIVILCVTVCLIASSASAEMKQFVQEPRSSSQDLTPFEPKLAESPIHIDYPSNWYVREEFEEGSAPSLFITREPVRTFTDKYVTGFAEYLIIDYVKNNPGSRDDYKIRLSDVLEKEGKKIIGVYDGEISGKNAIRIDFTTGNSYVIGIYIIGKDHLMLLTFETTLNEYEKYKGLFEDMMGSVKFEKNEVSPQVK